MSTGGFKVQTTKSPREAYMLCLLHDLNMCHRRPQPPDHQVLQHLHFTWSTIILIWLPRSTPPHLLLFVDVPKCQPHIVSLPAIFVPRSKPHVYPYCSQSIGTVCLYLIFSMSVDRLYASSTHAHQHGQETCYTCTHAMVSLQTQPKLIISWQSLIINSTHTRAHISHLFAVRFFRCMGLPI